MIVVQTRSQSDFSLYIEHLGKIVRRKCQRCRQTSCFACGESVSGDKARRPSTAVDDDPLFHCSNLQGAILGVGLSMLEQLFTEQTRESVSEQDPKARTSKRRRTNITTSSNVNHDGDDADEVYYAGLTINKKSKGGVGYAGDQREDVGASS